MKRTLGAALLAAGLLSTAAYADTGTLSTVPAQSVTVTNWYKQNVYDPADKQIGEVRDVLVTKDGTVSALIISVGGFLGMGSKDVAVPFSAVQQKTKDNKPYLSLDTTKEALTTAPGFDYDSNTLTWKPAKS
jgi:sporulation protein YlmC with PRC-barrel domain